MNKKILIFLISVLIFIASVLSGCSVEKGKIITNNITPESWEGLPDIVELDTRRLIVSDYTRKSFVKLIKKSGAETDTTDKKEDIFSESVKNKKYKEVKLIYTEYVAEMSAKFSYWTLYTSWYNKYEDQTITAHLTCNSKFVGLEHYTPVDEENRVYLFVENEDKPSKESKYLCLLNDSEDAFITFNIPKDCENFDEVAEDFIDYALEIKEIINS